MYGIIQIKRWLRYGLFICSAIVTFGIGGLLVFAHVAEIGVRIPVIMYHAVIDDSTRQGQYVISPQELECDFRWLKGEGYTPILSHDLIAYSKGECTLPEKPILLTFDDGYYNNYLYAFPLARQYGMKFILSPIGKYTDLYSETPDKSPYYAHCTWDMLREMQSSGLVEIGNHSYDLHSTENRTLGTKRLSSESMDSYAVRLREDILSAQKRFEKELNCSPTVFTYPFGAVSEGEPELIRNMGFAVTLSCEEKISTVTEDPNSLTALGRFLRPSGESSESFFSRVLG